MPFGLTTGCFMMRPLLRTTQATILFTHTSTSASPTTTPNHVSMSPCIHVNTNICLLHVFLSLPLSLTTHNHEHRLFCSSLCLLSSSFFFGGDPFFFFFLDHGHTFASCASLYPFFASSYNHKTHWAPVCFHFAPPTCALT